jgi:3-hydroxybutyryl-CoA dehydrogenase
MKNIRTVAVVGAGTMGLGIAQVCAFAGFETLLYDVRKEQVSVALAVISQNLSQSVEKGKCSTRQKDETVARIHTAHQISELKADIVIEAAIEKLEVKQQLFSQLEEINERTAILASNTSSISVTHIFSVLGNPGMGIGIHFFNPADRMKLVEIISGAATDPALIPVMKDFCGHLGKTSVLAKDSPGFIVNRVARHFYVESLKLLEEKVAEIMPIDALLRSAGFKMGPFELMDLIGVDTNLAVTESIHEGFQKAPRFRPSRIQQQLVKEGRFGKKTGRGFYEYSSKKDSA